MATGPTTSIIPESNPLHQGLATGERKRTWKELHSNVKSMRRIQMILANRVSLEFTFRVVKTDQGPRTRLYFLGVPPGNRENTLLYADMPTEDQEAAPDAGSQWKPLLIPFRGLMQSGNFSKEEQLLRERKRMGTFGITTYDLDVESGRFLFPANGSLFSCVDPDLIPYPLYPTEVPTQCQGVRMDAKLCPTNDILLAFINQSDLWVSDAISGNERRLTFAHLGLPNISNDPRSAGVTSYIIQEEFDRYTGYWWQPALSEEEKSDPVYRILYEEVDEGEVEILNIVAPGQGDGGVDRYRYPKAGTTNAKVTLKMVEFKRNEEGKIEESVEHKKLREPLKTIFPWMEYIIRLGWTPDGTFVWAQLLSRNQQSTVLVLIPLDSFVPVDQDTPMTPVEDPNKPIVHVLYEEHSDIWINAHNIIHFFPQTSPKEMSFIWASEATGTRHLYHITSALHPREAIPGSLKPAILKFDMLTTGQGEVSAHNLWVDEARSLVCYTALHDTPVEEHMYVVSYVDRQPPVRITPQGASLQSAMVSPDFQYCVCTCSSLTTPPFTTVFRLDLDYGSQPLGVTPKELFKLMQPQSTSFPFVPPELFVCKNSATGDDMYGLLFKPHNQEPGRQYPTIQFVYGGPQVQLVSNSFKGVRFLRLYTLANLGYTVVIVDGRGSCRRGLRFEGVLRNRLGQVELDDQVDGLNWIAAKSGCIDLNRVAIHGWSYGGYLSLMGLAKRPDVYKVAIAGAPVTCWTVYDTGYTERYLDTPNNNPTGYVQSSVLNLASSFPDEENRLLLVHGLIDENVHFHHSSLLIDELVKHCKPYNLQIYPQERHGIRRLETSEHYETNILSWLQQHL